MARCRVLDPVAVRLILKLRAASFAALVFLSRSELHEMKSMRTVLVSVLAMALAGCQLARHEYRQWDELIRVGIIGIDANGRTDSESSQRIGDLLIVGFVVTDKNGTPVEIDDPNVEAARLIDAGYTIKDSHGFEIHRFTE